MSVCCFSFNFFFMFWKRVCAVKKDQGEKPRQWKHAIVYSYIRVGFSFVRKIRFCHMSRANIFFISFFFYFFSAWSENLHYNLATRKSDKIKFKLRDFFRAKFFLSYRLSFIMKKRAWDDFIKALSLKTMESLYIISYSTNKYRKSYSLSTSSIELYKNIENSSY